MSSPLLTIAIPTVNRLPLMKLALASALAQSEPVDIILSDNGSTDGTKEYLASLPAAANLRLFRHETTMPVQQHGAFLVSQLRTEWVVFLSDDDRLGTGFAEAVAAIVRERPETALVYTGCDLTFGDVAVPARVGPRFESAAGFFYEFMRGNRNICMCATAFRTADWRRIGKQPEDVLIGDMYYWTRILARGGIVGCDSRPLSHYSFYRPGVPTQTSSNPVTNWYRESEGYASIMSDAVLADKSAAVSPVALGRAREKFLALTTSNQFAWNALRGARKLQLACSFVRLWRVMVRHLPAPPRAIASLLLPRSVLERRLLTHARRLAREAVAR